MTLEQEIYIQLLELYTFDLEVELLSEKLKNVRPLPNPIAPYPWTQPFTPYQPYWVTCETTN